MLEILQSNQPMYIFQGVKRKSLVLQQNEGLKKSVFSPTEVNSEQDVMMES